MKRLSIGIRLTLWYVLIFATAQALFGVGMWIMLRQHLYSITNHALLAQVEDMKSFLTAQPAYDTIAKLQEEVSEEYLIEHSGDYLQIADSDGNTFYRSRFLQANPLSMPPSFSPAYRDLKIGGVPFRFVAQTFDMHGHRFTMQTGIPTKDVTQTLSVFRRTLLIVAPLAFLIAACLGYWLSRRALAPVDALIRKAKTIGGENLSDRLEKLDTGDELQRLSDTLNAMLARIEGAFLRMTEFTADASHELRTPVALMRTEAELALRRTRSEAEYREALEHILRESERTTFLLEQMLSLARADSGRETLVFRQLNLRDVTQDLAEGWRAIAAIRNTQFEVQIESGALWISGDDAAVRRLMNILLDNAFKYTPEGGTVRLMCESANGKALFKVQDNGIGVEEAEQAKIFRRFYRVDKARSRQYGGSGLGLSIAQWIAQQHHGTIAVQSRLGEGSSFTVEMPMTQKDEHSTIKAEDAVRASNPAA